MTAPTRDGSGGSPVDLVAVQADHALLDALGRTGAVPSGWRAPQGNARFAQALLAWRRDAAAVTTPRTAAVPPPLRGRPPVPRPLVPTRTGRGVGPDICDEGDTPVSNSAADERFSARLIVDVFAVLGKHGYHEPDDTSEHNLAIAAAARELLRLTRAFEGRATEQPDDEPPPYPGPGRVPGSP